MLPFFYPDEGEFESFQDGYRLVSRKTGEELADDYAREDEAREEPEYKYFSVFIEDLGADKVKTLVFLKKFFEDGGFAATKDRAQNLPLCVFNGIEELALPLQDKLASLGVKFNAQEISFSENLSRVKANLSKFRYHTPHFLKRINMKKSLLFVALCAFTGQLAAAEMPAACEEYKKVSYDFIDSMAKQAQAQGKKDFDVAATKKEFEADYASIKKMSKEEQESTCNQGIAEVKELENMLKMMGSIK